MSDAGDGRGPDEADDATAADGGTTRLTQYFDVLADERRRLVLYYLNEHDDASVSELARYVVARDVGRSPDSLAEDEYEAAVSDLYHTHLPRLADHGLVEFDPRSQQVRFREPTRTFATLVWLSRLVEGE